MLDTFLLLLKHFAFPTQFSNLYVWLTWYGVPKYSKTSHMFTLKSHNFKTATQPFYIRKTIVSQNYCPKFFEMDSLSF